METIKDIISINKKFNSPVDQVWKAWTDPSQIVNWFGSDPNGTVLEATLDVQPGGYFKITFQDSDLTEHTCTGKYIEVLEYNKLSFTWMWKSEPGVESLLNISFIEDGNSTHMHFEHANTGTESQHGYYQGWLDTFVKLERMLSGRQ